MTFLLGSPQDAEDIILYILNGLPPAYNAFKIAIRTKLQPISLGGLYSLLCSEEVNITIDEVRELHLQADSTNVVSLTATHGQFRPHTSSVHGRATTCGTHAHSIELLALCSPPLNAIFV